jgi:outer membrane protein insertion porin family
LISLRPSPLLVACLALAGCAAPLQTAAPGRLPLLPPLVEVPDSPSPPPAGSDARNKALSAAATIRGQSPENAASGGGYGRGYPAPYGDIAPGSTDLPRQPMAASDATGAPINRYTQPGVPSQPTTTFQPGLPPPYPVDPVTGQPILQQPYAPLTPAEAFTTPSDIDVFVEEARTGRFTFGVAVNSNSGLTGQITVEERNFDLFRLPRSWDDLISGGAFRGGGQYLRLEAYPGNRVQRYLVSLTEPYLLGTNVSGSISASYFDRNYFDYFESRYGGRLALGYRLTPDLSTSLGVRAENVGISDPRVAGVPELERVLGRSDLFGGKVSLMHDTRDLAFMPTEGHLIQISGEQVFGDFDYPRAEAEYNKYWMLRERPDGSGRHVLAFSSQVGFMGEDAPLFEHYFAGGFSTLRGFSFRGAGPIDTGVRVGGEFQWISSLEYFFPLTADDMVKGVVFCDFGMVEERAAFDSNFRVAPGIGLRISVPAFGPAPLALDFAFPVSYEDTDDRQTFSFFFGASRGQ